MCDVLGACLRLKCKACHVHTRLLKVLFFEANHAMVTQASWMKWINLTADSRVCDFDTSLGLSASQARSETTALPRQFFCRISQGPHGKFVADSYVAGGVSKRNVLPRQVFASRVVGVFQKRVY